MRHDGKAAVAISSDGVPSLLASIVLSTGTLPWPAQGTMHLWLASLSNDQHELQRDFELLGAEERQRAVRYAFARDRDPFIRRRAMLRKMISAYLDIPPHGITFTTGAHGKPMLAAPHAALTFNCSHAAGVALYAFTRHLKIGVDIERVDTRYPILSVARHVLTLAEEAVLAAHAENERYQTFFQWWTRKEACVKASGHGLSHSLQAFDVSKLPGHAWHHVPGGWLCRDLVLPTGFMGAVAVADKTCR